MARRAAPARTPGSKEIRKEIEAGRIPPVWLWTGPEDFLKDDLFERLVLKRVDEGSVAFNVDRFRAVQDDLDRILTTARTLPMLGTCRAILLRDIERLGKKDRERLLAYVASPVPETALVLTGSRSPKDSFHLRLAKAGVPPAVFWTPFPEQTRQWIQIRFRDLGKTCPPSVAEALLLACGGGLGTQVPLREVAPEIEKVALTVGDRETLTEEDLGVIPNRPGEDLIRQVCARAGAGDLSGALRALDGALRFKENEPPRVMWMLGNYCEKLSLAGDLLASGADAKDVKKRVGVWNEAEWTQMRSAARRFQGAPGRRAISAVARADRALKSTGVDKRLLLEATLGAICG